MTPKKVTLEAFQEGMRAAVLDALDAYLRAQLEHESANGWEDSDLTALLPAIDAHAIKIADRINDPESNVCGSHYLDIRLPTHAQGASHGMHMLWPETE